eukprot:5188391-Pleurochrysis_carterae.AAC.4
MDSPRLPVRARMRQHQLDVEALDALATDARMPCTRSLRRRHAYCSLRVRSLATHATCWHMNCRRPHPHSREKT